MRRELLLDALTIVLVLGAAYGVVRLALWWRP